MNIEQKREIKIKVYASLANKIQQLDPTNFTEDTKELHRIETAYFHSEIQKAAERFHKRARRMQGRN